MTADRPERSTPQDPKASSLFATLDLFVLSSRIQHPVSLVPWSLGPSFVGLRQHLINANRSTMTTGVVARVGKVGLERRLNDLKAGSYDRALVAHGDLTPANP